MRLRMHDKHGWAVSRPDGDWDGPMGQTFIGRFVYGPGWRELVVLDPDADAQRLAEAIYSLPAEIRNYMPGPISTFARVLLDRLAAGTEGERG